MVLCSLIMRWKGRDLAVFFVLAFACVATGSGDQPAECTTLQQCNNIWKTGEAFTCEDGRCKCHPQAVYDPPTGSCVCLPRHTKSGNLCLNQPPEPNGSLPGLPGPRSGAPLSGCKSNSDCQQNAECTLNRCECLTNYTKINATNACVKAATRVGEYCEYNEVCTHNLGGRSNCELTKCVCNTASVPVLDDTKCFEKRDLGTTCTHHEQCRHVQNTYCTDICVCDPGFVALGTTCSKVVNQYRGICNDTAQCSEGKLGVGASCQKDNDSNDNERRCICEKEYFYKKDVQKCMYAKGIDDACDGKNDACYLKEDEDKQNIECVKNKCTCKRGYIASVSKTKCEKDAGVLNQASYLLMTLALAYVTRW